MKNVLRGLIIDDQVSLTVIDCTEIAREAYRLHVLCGEEGHAFLRALSFGAYLSACLKELRGQVSAEIRCEKMTVSVSGNYALRVRGSFEPYATDLKNFGEGGITVIRDDGYSRPFVGLCALTGGAPDDDFSEYFRVSEQLPTTVCTVVETDEKGGVVFSGIAVLQPLPFAEPRTLEIMPKYEELQALLAKVKKQGVGTVKKEFALTTVTERRAEYKCNCSKGYLRGVLQSLGEAEMRKIIREDGAVRVHCHYCNTDYAFDETDADEMFSKEE